MRRSAPSITLQSLDGSRCYGTVCADSLPGGAQTFPKFVSQNSEYPIAVGFGAATPGAYTVTLAVSNSDGGCEFSATKVYPAAHVTEVGYPNEAHRILGSRAWETPHADMLPGDVREINNDRCTEDTRQVMCTVRDSRMQVPCNQIFDRSRQPTGYDHIRQPPTGQDAGFGDIKPHDSTTGFVYDDPTSDHRTRTSELIGVKTETHTAIDDTYGAMPVLCTKSNCAIAAELGHDFRDLDVQYGSAYASSMSVSVPGGSTVHTVGYLRCKHLHSVGPTVTVSISGQSSTWQQALPVLSPCRYPMEAGPRGANDMHADGTLLSSFGSGHCTHECEVSTIGM